MQVLRTADPIFPSYLSVVPSNSVCCRGLRLWRCVDGPRTPQPPGHSRGSLRESRVAARESSQFEERHGRHEPAQTRGGSRILERGGGRGVWVINWHCFVFVLSHLSLFYLYSVDERGGACAPHAPLDPRLQTSS